MKCCVQFPSMREGISTSTKSSSKNNMMIYGQRSKSRKNGQIIFSRLSYAETDIQK